MVGSYSPHSDAGGTLHFPSPTHIHHVDPTSAFRQLRRSLSRSPSKIAAFRLVTSKSTSPSPSSPLSPSREPLPNRSLSANILSPPKVSTTSPLTTPYQPSTRKTRPASRKLSPLSNSTRANPGQRSPRKRTLQESANRGNATPQSSADSNGDQENQNSRSISPSSDPMLDVTFKSSMPTSHSSPFPPPRATAKFEKGHSSWGTKSSPLKRSDGIMNLDQGNVGSPSAKRRSLHGGFFSPDFDIFDHAPTFDGQSDAKMIDSSSDLDRAFFREQPLPMPNRTSSLRRTTLQQRHDKPSFARSKPNTDLALEFTTPSQVSTKNRFRMSLDSVLPPMPRDSPFSSQGTLPNASSHPMSQQAVKLQGSGEPAPSQRHPLSRTISQSTSNSSVAEDSPTHVPVRHAEQRRHLADFSRSMPVGANRPTSRDRDPNSQGSLAASFATPENYKLVKPLPAAFMSTGLISKRHKDIEDCHATLRASTSTMPDTPCKRHSLAEIPSPRAPKEDTFVKTHQARHSFGTPSTPFNPHTSCAVPVTFGKGVNIFGSTVSNRGCGGLQRRASFLSFEGDDQSQSPSGKIDSQSSAEFEIPPTPTRHIGGFNNGHHSSFGGSTSRNQSGHEQTGPSSGEERPSTQHGQQCKSISIGTPSGKADGHGNGLMEDSPSVALNVRSFSSMPRSFTHSRLLRNSRSPTPLSRASCTAPAYLARRSKAKPSPLSPASPPDKCQYHLSPRTPRESVLPPDPSGLSISQQCEEEVHNLNKLSSSASVFPPATPTASKDYFASFNKSRISVTPSHVSAPVEVDPALTSRFDKVELIGTGEFSQVYRVSRKQDLKRVPSYFSLPLTRGSPKTPVPDHVWAVKKTRHAYIGPKDRQRKLQEIIALRALGQSEHTLELIESWEDRNHLYIQTEFCEEGSLDLFLGQVGRHARLDDFRIWKIMLELSLGLQHIHDSGFIHLDLKPANVLITFEGILKIADFGMAARWPAQPGIDGEGDREYIGPEILCGQYDKPADIFALGLIMLEIAANVELPDNGASWQRLRSGDMSDVPSLTWSSENSNILRDSSGKPLSQSISVEEFFDSDSGDEPFSPPDLPRGRRSQHIENAPVHPQRSGELAEPPAFMVDQNNPEALDNLVRWMISPKAADRPSVHQILDTTGVQWAERRRRAGATIFEGNWGPADEVLADDAEMIDV
ncbi:MAG: hypothetical protein Q9163_001645 [Psora crenata]